MRAEDRIQTVKRYMPEQDVEIPLYQRYIWDETELWLFGSGLGEHTMFMQIGDCFLQLMEEHDPGLGRIMMTLGHSASAFMGYQGDYNVAWVWGVYPDNLRSYFSRLNVKPDLLLCAWDITRAMSEQYGIPSLPIFSGVNPRVFKPLGLEREGLGYAGIDNKGAEQKRIILEPAKEYGKLDWISKEHSPLLTIDEYNHWLNSKKIVFGMVSEDRHQTTYIPTRMVETIASGTPIITYKIRDFEKIMGIKYPYQTTSAEETKELIDSVLTDYDTVIKRFEMLSIEVRKKHSYKVKLQQIFDKLEEIK